MNLTELETKTLAALFNRGRVALLPGKLTVSFRSERECAMAFELLAKAGRAPELRTTYCLVALRKAA